MVLRNGPGSSPCAGVSRIAHSGHSSCGIALARAASRAGLSAGMLAAGVPVR